MPYGCLPSYLGDLSLWPYGEFQQSNLASSISLGVERKSFYPYTSFPKLERISTLYDWRNFDNLSVAAARVSSFLQTAKRAKCLPMCLSDS